MSNLDDILIGKRADNGVYQSLDGHTVDSLKVFGEYLNKNIYVVKHFCSKWNVKSDDFIKNVFTLIFLHDCGKSIEEFQDRIRENKHSPDYPHAYHSIHIILKVMLDKINLFKNIYERKVPLIEMSSIMAHHSQLHREIYDNVEKVSKCYNDNLLNNFLNKASEFYYQLGFDKFAGDYNVDYIATKYESTDIGSVRIILGKFKHICDERYDIEYKCKNKAIFTYMLSLLKTSDILASKYFEAAVLNYKSNSCLDSVLNKEILSSIKVLSINEILDSNVPYEYQKELINIYSNTIIVAGCGRGKTEASQIVANNNIRVGNANRIIYAMPTQVTSNAMANRMSSVYGKENVGLYHGKSLINKLMISDNDELDYKEIKDENYACKNFMKPVCITTVDHILYSLVHAYKSSDFACGNLQTSVIIFDEIHYYERDTMEYIFEALKLLREMKIPHILMSATLPEFIIKEVRDKYLYVEDKEGLLFEPFVMKRVDEFLICKRDERFIINMEFLDKVYKNYKKGLRQTIIVNTVEKAQKIYEKIVEMDSVHKDNVILFHGRFTVDDRKNKEIEIFDNKCKYPFILVTTQIIEVSIDISCNIMYTELAPFDALAQRGGRLNRRGSSYLVNGFEQIMYVYNIENMRPYAKNEYDPKYYIIEQSWLSITDKPISYNRIKNIVNDIYSNEKLLQTQYTGLFIESSLFGNTPEDVRGMKVDEDTGGYFSTRSNDFKQIDVIPSVKAPDCIDFIEASRNIVKIPLYLYYQYPGNFYKQVIDNVEYIVCRFKYTYEKGVELGIEDKSGYIC